MNGSIMRREYRDLNQEEKNSISSIKEHGEWFVKLLEVMPSSRELSIAKTKIEEAVMWAVKGITR